MLRQNMSNAVNFLSKDTLFCSGTSFFDSVTIAEGVLEDDSGTIVGLGCKTLTGCYKNELIFLKIIVDDEANF